MRNYSLDNQTTMKGKAKYQKHGLWLCGYPGVNWGRRYQDLGSFRETRGWRGEDGVNIKWDF